MLELIDPVATIPWPNIVLILVTAVLSSALIVFSTQRSVRSIGIATARMVASIEGAHRATQAAGSAGEDVILTLGRGEVAWHEGGYTMRLVRRVRPGVDAQGGDEFLANLAQKLFAQGISGDDLKDRIDHVDEETVAIGMDVVVRDPSNGRGIVEAALGAGFTENGTGREEITSEDAHDLAGRRAIQDAQRNIDTLSDALGIPRSSIQMIGADLESLALEGCTIVKIARARWRAMPDESLAA